MLFANYWAWEIGSSESDGWQSVLVWSESEWLRRPKQRWSASWEIMGLGLWHHFRRRAGDALVAAPHPALSFSAHSQTQQLLFARPANGPTATCGTCAALFIVFLGRANRSDIGPRSRFLRHKGIRSLVGPPLSREIEWLKWSADGWPDKEQRLDPLCPRSKQKPQIRTLCAAKGCGFAKTVSKKMQHMIL
jgi:hypothetical protein